MFTTFLNPNDRNFIRVDVAKWYAMLKHSFRGPWRKISVMWEVRVWDLVHAVCMLIGAIDDPGINRKTFQAQVRKYGNQFTLQY